MKITRRTQKVLQAHPDILKNAGIRQMFRSILSYDPPAAGRYLEIVTTPPDKQPGKAFHQNRS